MSFALLHVYQQKTSSTWLPELVRHCVSFAVTGMSDHDHLHLLWLHELVRHCVSFVLQVCQIMTSCTCNGYLNKYVTVSILLLQVCHIMTTCTCLPEWIPPLCQFRCYRCVRSWPVARKTPSYLHTYLHSWVNTSLCQFPCYRCHIITSCNCLLEWYVTVSISLLHVCPIMASCICLPEWLPHCVSFPVKGCLLYTSDAADES